MCARTGYLIESGFCDHDLFPKDVRLSYRWKATTHVGTLLPSEHLTEYSLEARLLVRNEQNFTTFQVHTYTSKIVKYNNVVYAITTVCRRIDDGDPKCGEITARRVRTPKKNCALYRNVWNSQARGVWYRIVGRCLTTQRTCDKFLCSKSVENSDRRRLFLFRIFRLNLRLYGRVFVS